MARKRNAGNGKEDIAGRQIDFLGYCFTRDNVRMRKSIKKRFARKVKQTKNVERKKQVLASYWGWCKWGNCRHLWNVITDYDMSFANRGISGSMSMKDGKRYFRNREVRAFEILNNPIVVLDFETGIKTKHGPDRYAVLIRKQGENEICKLVTNSFSIKSVLDQARTHDRRLKELVNQVDEACHEGRPYDPESLGWSKDDIALYEENQPVLPCETILKRRDIGNGKYDYYFE